MRSIQFHNDNPFHRSKVALHWCNIQSIPDISLYRDNRHIVEKMQKLHEALALSIRLHIIFVWRKIILDLLKEITNYKYSSMYNYKKRRINR